MAAEIRFTVDKTNKGKTVERILKSRFGVSASLLTYLKQNGRLLKNGNICRSVDVCNTGDVIVADVSENIDKPENIEIWEFEPDILFEDDFFAAVSKPGGMEVHPCPSNRRTTLANAMMYHWSQNGEYHNYHIVNRLDKETSGICIIAKNRFAHGVLANQMKGNIFRRGYTAICHGVFEPSDGVVEMPIKMDSESIIKRIVANDGKYAKTNYKTIGVYKNGLSEVSVFLETGRTHQIRVHFSHLGHPLVGDWLYGNGDNERNLIKRHALHAGFVEFIHPLTGIKMIFKTDLPEDMKKLLITL